LRARLTQIHGWREIAAPFCTKWSALSPGFFNDLSFTSPSQ